MATPSYVPILKGKEGEFAALEVLSEEVRAEIMPLIEVPSVPYDYSNSRPSKSLEDHVSAVADRIRRSWPDRALYVDSTWIEAEVLPDGRDPITAMLENCSRLQIAAVPIVSLATSDRALASAGRYSDANGSGCGVRLLIEDFEEDIDLEGELNRIFNGLARVPTVAVDLIVDMEDLGTDAGRAVLLARSVLSLVPRKDEWRRIILSTASFPEDLSEVDASAVSLLPRREGQLWRALLKRPAGLPRQRLIYSDYAIAHPLPKELDPRTMRMSASIRYTTREEWLIVKGRNVRQYGFEQYFELCRTLVTRQEYFGRNFSWGDDYIAQCAAEALGPGNATTWRKVGTNHHITVIADLLRGSQLVS